MLWRLWPRRHCEPWQRRALRYSESRLTLNGLERGGSWLHSYAPMSYKHGRRWTPNPHASAAPTLRAEVRIFGSQVGNSHLRPFTNACRRQREAGTIYGSYSLCSYWWYGCYLRHNR